MCGIAGFINPRLKDADILRQQVQAMTDSIRHRGPDDEGFWLDAAAGLALGHRRLSIRDLSPTGHQPMVSSDGQWVMVYNGETYSQAELVPQLIAHGIHLKGTSDTEVMLESCAAFGVEQAVKQFIGMFAFALWHRPTQRLHLICDRVGIKPLYWTQMNGGLAFASELKALRKLISPPLDEEALSIYLRYGYIPAPRTIYRGVHKLEPGKILTYGPDRSVSQYSYWSLADVVHQQTRQISEQTALQELEALLTDAVGRRLLADVPLGAFLSGGIDSSLVVALMQKQNTTPVKTFSIGFQDKDYNEAPHAKAVAAHLKTDHHELYVTPQEAQAVIPQLPDIYDEPFADLSQIPTYLVSALTRPHVKVALSGDGGDELFAGYTRYHWVERIWKLQQHLPGHQWIGRQIQNVPLHRWQQVARAFPFLPKRFGERLHRLAELMHAKNPQAIYQNLVSLGLSPEIIMPQTAFPHLPQFYPQDLDHPTKTLQYIDMMTYLPGDILTKVDRASMAVSLEARVPLLDHRVIEWAWQLPMSLKTRGKSHKYILRQLLNKYVPRHLVDRPKMGFGVPMDQWLRGSLKEWAADLIFDPTLKEFFEIEPIRAYWQEHQKQEKNNHYALWVILMFQAWRKRWL